MQMKKRILPILMILIVVLSVCGGNRTGETINLTLYADFSNGMPDSRTEEKQITLLIDNGPTSRSQIAFGLADGLSEWTGLDFTLNGVSFPDEESIIVDWSKDSTLTAGPGNREFKEGFHFYDTVSLTWFMMDSLATTFKNNLGIANVYYQSEAQPVIFDSPVDMAQQGLPELPIDQAYEGSAFFHAHAGGRGDIDWMVNEPIVNGVIFTGSLLQSDPGNNMTPYEAASRLYFLVLKDKLVNDTDYSREEPMFITCVDVTNINGEECYLLSVSGMFNTKAWEFAVNYDYNRQNIYLLSETGSNLLGSFLDPEGLSNMVNSLR